MADGLKKTGAIVVLVLCASSLSGCVWQAAKFWVAGDEIKLRDNPADAAPADKPKLLIVAIDGIDRHLLYDSLRRGELPEMARLLGDDGGRGFAHAYFDETLESTLPSSTGVSWATMITGRNPAETGVTGNEFFIRETGQFAAPVPVTVPTALPVFKIYTEGYANALLEVPTLYEHLRVAEPAVRIWVGMHQYHAGADRLILTDRTVMLDLFQSLFAGSFIDITPDSQSLSAFKELDQEVIENMADLIEDGQTPADVITIYLPGLDHYAHVNAAPPDVVVTENPPRYVGPIVAGNRVLVISKSGQVHMFDPDNGAEIGTKSLGMTVLTPPQIAAGKLLVLGVNGTLSAFE